MPTLSYSPPAILPRLRWLPYSILSLALLSAADFVLIRFIPAEMTSALSARLEFAAIRALPIAAALLPLVMKLRGVRWVIAASAAGPLVGLAEYLLFRQVLEPGFLVLTYFLFAATAVFVTLVSSLDGSRVVRKVSQAAFVAGALSFALYQLERFWALFPSGAAQFSMNSWLRISWSEFLSRYLMLVFLWLTVWWFGPVSPLRSARWGSRVAPAAALVFALACCCLPWITPAMVHYSLRHGRPFVPATAYERFHFAHRAPSENWDLLDSADWVNREDMKSWVPAAIQDAYAEDPTLGQRRLRQLAEAHPMMAVLPSAARLLPPDDLLALSPDLLQGALFHMDEQCASAIARLRFRHERLIRLEAFFMKRRMSSYAEDPLSESDVEALLFHLRIERSDLLPDSHPIESPAYWYAAITRLTRDTVKAPPEVSARLDHVVDLFLQYWQDCGTLDEIQEAQAATRPSTLPAAFCGYGMGMNYRDWSVRGITPTMDPPYAVAPPTLDQPTLPALEKELATFHARVQEAATRAATKP